MSGSTATANTIGITDVTCFAASAAPPTVRPQPPLGQHIALVRSSQGLAALRKFNPANVSNGSFSSHQPAPDALGMSASLRSRPNLPAHRKLHLRPWPILGAAVPPSSGAGSNSHLHAASVIAAPRAFPVNSSVSSRRMSKASACRQRCERIARCGPKGQRKARCPHTYSDNNRSR